MIYKKLELKLFLSFWLWRATTGGHLPGKALSIVAGGAWASYLHGEDEEDSHRHRLIIIKERSFS